MAARMAWEPSSAGRPPAPGRSGAKVIWAIAPGAPGVVAASDRASTKAASTSQSAAGFWAPRRSIDRNGSPIRYGRTALPGIECPTLMSQEVVTASGRATGTGRTRVPVWSGSLAITAGPDRRPDDNRVGPMVPSPLIGQAGQGFPAPDT